MNPKIAALINHAVQHFHNGDLEPAEQVLKKVLRKQPGNFDALHILGVIKGLEDDKEEAIRLFKKALLINEGNNFVYFNLAKALSESGRDEESLPHHAKATELAPDHHEAWLNYGRSQTNLGLHEQAIASYDRAIQLNSDYAEAWYNKGVALDQLKRHHESIAAYGQALRIRPDFVDAWINKGAALDELKRYDEALVAYEQALRFQPASAKAWANRGLTLHELKRYEEALADYERALSIQPDNSVAWTNKGFTLGELKRYDEALSALGRAIDIQPDNIRAWTNKGFTLGELKRYDEAMAVYTAALSIQPDDAETNHNLAHLYLLRMQFDKGWEQYEWRWLARTTFNSPRLTTQKPLWDGGRSGERLLVWGEQGIGDQILYGSLLGELRQYPQKKIISVDSRLIPLFRRVFPEYEYPGGLSEAGKLDYDFQIPMGSLGRYFRHSPQDFSGGQYPYLKADEALAARIRQQIRKEDGLLCGLSWKSNNKNFGDDKSLSLLNLLPILSLKNCQFVDLQYGDTGIERSPLEEKFGISIHGVDGIDNYSNIDGLASVIEACDLVVTVSNTTAHLAGALSKKTLLLLPFSRGKLWYWHHINGRSLWYPSVSVFEQPAPGDWAAPVAQIAAILKK